MNIETTTKTTLTQSTRGKITSSSSSKQNGRETSFVAELNTLSKEVKNEKDVDKNEAQKEANSEDKVDSENKSASEDAESMDDVIDGLQNTVEEMNKLGQAKDKSDDLVKDSDLFDVNKANDEDNGLINNDININETKKEQILPQMNANMNFNSDGQPFSEFVQNQTKRKLRASASDLDEENAVLSTMEENIAMVNKNRILNQEQNLDEAYDAKVKTVLSDEGIKKVDANTKITVETVVKFDNVIMNKDDVEFFTQLVENGAVEMDSQAAVKSSKVSKTLADLIAKSMQDNKPVRIDFDNNISVIIKIGKDGKISADFLPSSQVAEAYLKENLPLLRQRFDDNNIDYDSLNQRKQKQEDKNNQKKERKHE